jgi:hypothetical protein
MLKANCKYNAVVTGGGLFEAGTGTMGYQVFLKCEDGETDYTIWLTTKNRDGGRIEKDFKTLGVPISTLKTAEGIHSIGDAITGREVSFGTALDVYKDKERIKVVWIGEKRPESSGDLFADAAAFMGGAPAPIRNDLPDEEIPF